jgi:CDP-paratose synthetase
MQTKLVTRDPQKSSKICLLTGATGFLGSNILRTLIEQNWQVLCTKRKSSRFDRIYDLKESVIWIDLENYNLLHIFDKFKIDGVIHCATDYGHGQKDPLQIVDSNLILPLKLLHLSSKNNVQFFLNTDTILPKITNSYSLSKRQFYDWLQTYSEKIMCINVGIEHFYGPSDDPTKFTSFILHSLLASPPPLTLPLTEGHQKRDFIYIDDVVNALIMIIDNAISQNNRGLFDYQIGSGSAIEVREFVKLAKILTGNITTRLDFGAIPLRNNEILDPKLDLSRIKSLGWSPKFSTREGLLNTIRSILI